MAGVADRVLGEVLGHDPEHPRPKRQVDARVAGPRAASTPARRGGVVELLDDLLEHRQRVRAAERDDLLAALELGEEEDLVDQRAGVLDLGARLVDQRLDVGARQVGRVEQREDPRERRPQLVRDGGGEARAELVERRLVAAGCGVRPRRRSPDRHHSVTWSEPATELS